MIGTDNLEWLDSAYRQHRGLVYGVCRWFVRDHETAQDMCQQTFLNVASRPAGFQGRSKISTWLVRAAINQCISHLRRVQMNVSLDSISDIPEPRSDKTVEDRLIFQDQIEKLPESIRPLVHRLLEGHTMKDAAALEGLHPEAAKKRFYRVRQQYCAASQGDNR